MVKCLWGTTISLSGYAQSLGSPSNWSDVLRTRKEYTWENTGGKLSMKWLHVNNECKGKTLVTRNGWFRIGQCSEGGARKELSGAREALTCSMIGHRYPVENLVLLPTYWSRPRGKLNNY